MHVRPLGGGGLTYKDFIIAAAYCSQHEQMPPGGFFFSGSGGGGGRGSLRVTLVPGLEAIWPQYAAYWESVLDAERRVRTATERGP